MAGEEFNKLKKVIEEVQKPGRDFLYNLKNPNYKNNKLKQIVWAEIAESMDVSKTGIQNFWKRNKLKYRAALINIKPPSGSPAKQPKEIEKFLMKEMDFLRPYIEDDDIRSTNYINSNSCNIQLLLDDMAADPEVMSCGPESSTSTSSPGPKRRRTSSSTETALLNALQGIESKLESSAPSERDKFYDYIEQEIEKKTSRRQEKNKKCNFAIVNGVKM